jgi:hypothetical protein
MLEAVDSIPAPKEKKQNKTKNPQTRKQKKKSKIHIVLSERIYQVDSKEHFSVSPNSVCIGREVEAKSQSVLTRSKKKTEIPKQR